MAVGLAQAMYKANLLATHHLSGPVRIISANGTTADDAKRLSE
jgi:hypothetical protein